MIVDNNDVMKSESRTHAVQSTTSFEDRQQNYISSFALSLRDNEMKHSLVSLLTLVLLDLYVHIPENTKYLYNIYTTSSQRLRRWSNIV